MADGRRTTSYGVNLLEGLQIQFGGIASRTLTNGGIGAPRTEGNSLTRSLKIPDINYSLNIFNRGNRYYEVTAKPSLTASIGQTSTFFLGEQLFVNVSSQQSGSLEKIDIRLTIKLTLSEITKEGTKFKVEADRSFFSDQGAGSFRKLLATLKPSVSAAAEVRFGERLMIRGLNGPLKSL